MMKMSLEKPSAIDVPDIEGRKARNRMSTTASHDILGARAALETFYNAFNTRNLGLMTHIWLNDPLVQLSTPFVGIIHGRDNIAKQYERAFSAPDRMVADKLNFVEYWRENMVVYAGRERAEYSSGDTNFEIESRTTSVVMYSPERKRWRMAYHNVSIDDSELLARYERAIRQPSVIHGT